MSPAWPKLEVAEPDKQITVSAEIPGMEEKDVELLFDDGNLIVRGEVKSETEDKERQFSERFYGRFERRIPVGMAIEESKIEASFKNGVLKVTLPTEQTKERWIVRCLLDTSSWLSPARRLPIRSPPAPRLSPPPLGSPDRRRCPSHSCR